MQIALESFVQDIIHPRNYSSNAVLVRDSQGQALVTLPDSLSKQALDTWMKSLPDSNSPAWIGLPTSAENQLKRTIAQRALANLAILEGMLSVDEVDISASNSTNESSAAAVHKGQQKILLDVLQKWLSLLPNAEELEKIVDISGSKNNTNNGSVLARTLIREIQYGTKVLEVVKNDLHSVK
jgi:dynein heavy chain 1, cytosolic